MARKTSAGVDMTGPFFKSDPAKTFRKNIRAFMDEVAELGEADVKAQMKVGEGARAPIRRLAPAHVSAYVVGRTSNLSGKRWAVTAVVSVNNSGFTKAQGISLMAAASEVERQTGAFARTTRRLRKARTNLLKGLT